MTYSLITGGEKWTQVASLAGWKEFREWVEEIESDDIDELRHLVEYGWSQKLPDLTEQLTETLSSGKPSADVKDIGQTVLAALEDAPDGAESAVLTDGLASIDDPDDSGWSSTEDEEDEPTEPDSGKGIEAGDIETPEGIPPPLSRKAIEKAHVKRVTDAEGRASESIAEFFRDFLQQTSARVAKSRVKLDPSKDARKQAEAILKKAFDPKEHLKGLVRAIAPHLAASFCVGAGAELELTKQAAIRKKARGLTGEKYSPDQPRDELGRFGSGGGSGESTGSESMIVEPSEQDKKDEDRYNSGMAAWERYRDTRERMRAADGTDDWDRPGGLKQRMEEATHIDKLGSKLKRMQGAVKAQYTRVTKIQIELADLENKRNSLQKFIETGPTNPATGESTAHEYQAELADIDKRMGDLADQFTTAQAAYEKVRDTKMDRMVEAVRDSIKERMQDQLAVAQRVSMQAEPGNKSQEAIDKAKAIVAGCVSEKVDWKAATCAIKDCDAAVYGGNRAYFSPGNIHDQANMTLGTMSLPEGGADYKTVIHEYGHCLEQDYKVASACQAFLWHRVGNENPVSMQDAAPNRGYDKYELGRKDEFDKAFTNEEAHYIGKFYQSGGSEVLSMGMEKLFYNPREFAEKDPEYFKFVIGVLDGSLL